MTLRKTAGLLAAVGLMAGLLGSGVGASFLDSVTATENIAVGTFGCGITDATAGATFGNAYDGYYHSVSYTAPTITSSAAGSAPFSFTVNNYGSIPDTLTVTAGGPYGSLSAKFSPVAAAPAGPVNLAAGASQVFAAGIQWTTLDNTDLGDSGSVTWTVSCGEQSRVHTYTSSLFTFGGNFPDGGWAGWSCAAGETIVSVTANVTNGGPYNVGLAKPGQTTDGFTYPVYPHWTYTPPEQGGVIHEVGVPGQASITIVCAY